ncbi:ABC transporter permease [Candidatus Nomurabacteria bacterium]|nr:ABC transporter permease [Candidatus Saccharibacteria bacterium]MCB9839711.1 ABC transporter permease [Candidatus Nomurabacteria bacterium]
MASELQFENKSRLTQALIDSFIMIKRSSTHIIRNTDQLLGTFFQPIMFLVLFSAVFGGAISLALPEGVSYLSFLMAGIIVQTVAFGSTTTAVAITNDLQKGIVDRFRSLPMANGAVLNGHVVSDLFRNTISTIVMLIAGLALGFRSSASFIDWLAIAGILVLFTFSFSWLMAIVGVLAKSVEGVQWLSFVIIFPLTFASSAFVPTEGMNQYLRAFAENQPISQVIEAVRALMLGMPLNDHGFWAIFWCIIILLISVPLAIVLFKNKTNS